MSRTMVPINIPFLYSETKIAITPTSNTVGLNIISPSFFMDTGGEEEIGLDAEYPAL